MTNDLEKQFNQIVKEFEEKAFKATNKALEEAAEDVRRTMAGATQNVKTGKFKAGWKVKKYANVKYVYNGPLTNIVEFSSRGPKPFIRETWSRVQTDTKRKVIQKLTQNLK